jgi:hypothetical protein
MVYNAPFNNISVLLWRSVLLVEESGENPLTFAFILYIHVYVTYETSNMKRGRRGRDRMVVGFTTTFMQSVPITTKIVSSNPFHGEMYVYVQYESKCEWIVPCTVLYKVYVFYVDRTIQYGCHGRTRFFIYPYDLDLHCIMVTLTYN